MKWNTRLKRSGPLSAAATVVALLICGCHEWPNVFLDDLPPASAVTTASMQRARKVPAVDQTRPRDFAAQRVEAQVGTVAHGPLWMEDPVEMGGSEDGQFAVTLEDAVSFPYDVCRYIVNLGCLPLSMIVDPPGAIVCSDGFERRSRWSWLPEPYDAERCSGTPEPVDVLDAWTIADVPAPPPAAAQDAEALAETTNE